MTVLLSPALEPAAGLPTQTTRVDQLPARCPTCAGPYYGGLASARDFAELARYRCPICRWHVYLLPPVVGSPSQPHRGRARGAHADDIPGLCPFCGARVPVPTRRVGRPRRFCSKRHAVLWWQLRANRERHFALRPYLPGG